MAVDFKALEEAKKQVKVVSYSRVSTLGQLDGVSLDYQLEKAQAYAQWQGYNIVQEYVERGESGSYENRENRRELKKLIQDAEEKKFDLLVVYSPDRLSRNHRTAVETMYHLDDLGIGIVFLNPMIDTRDEMGKMLFSFLSHFAELDRKSITTRLNMGRRDKVKKGNWISKKPYGYDVKDGKLIVNNFEAEVVKTIFKLRAYDKMTLRAIAEELNNQQISSPSGRGKWNHTSVSVILKNKLYMGVCTQNIEGEIIEIDMDFEPLTTKQMFGRANN
ncbi:recombinase family protein [Priestia endophytica]|uniref:recombinase family protein n=1 Tax=Priestia endophytica TaxID=135735 RepID=UPI003D29ED2C